MDRCATPIVVPAPTIRADLTCRGNGLEKIIDRHVVRRLDSAISFGVVDRLHAGWRYSSTFVLPFANGHNRGQC
jgi:hypothetical protein